MKKYILKKFIYMLITIFVICTLTFFICHTIPGSPFLRERKALGPALKLLNEKYAFDKPIMTQYWIFLKHLLHGDMGVSIIKKVSVNQLISSGLPNSMRIGLVAIFFIVVISFPLGIIAALKKDTIIDKIICTIASLGVIVPSFICGALIIYIFCERLSWLPIGGLSSAIYYVGPVITISLFNISFTIKLMRSSMIDVLSSDYIKAARVYGFSRYNIIIKHALKNALRPVITYLGPTIGTVLTGTFVAEKLFCIAGVGQYFTDSIISRDYSVVMGMTIICSTFYVVAVFVVDLCYMALDPKVRLG